MSRKPQTCSDCSRRKIKCNKIIPCDNCTKRGAADSCRRAEFTHSIDRQVSRPSQSASPRLSFPTLAESRRPEGVISINEQILSLVTTLSERVKNLEAKIDSNPQSSKRYYQEEPFQHDDSYQSRSPDRPYKYARLAPAEATESGSQIANDPARNTENESLSRHNSFDAEAEDAATVLEFLAWGRLKESNLTSAVRDLNGSSEMAAYPNKDVFQAAQAWESSSYSIPTGPKKIEVLQMSQIQDLIPRRVQVTMLFEYHTNWLLFLHCSFHANTFSRELTRFYDVDRGIINMTTGALQWASLMFAILCGSMNSAIASQVTIWGFHKDDQGMLAKQWYHASIECMNIAKYQENHNLYSIQAITTLTISAHVLGFSNSQSVLLAAAVRVAHSLGIHRLSRSKKVVLQPEGEISTNILPNVIAARVWQQLVLQDWFSVPFSETYCVSPLHFTTKQPLHCDEENIQPIPPSQPCISGFNSFLFKVASLMPTLQDRISHAVTLNTKYEQVLHFDEILRELILSQLPSWLNSQTEIDPSWPCWVPLSRRCLTITSAHKIIMIHRKFLGMSFHDKRFAFTRRTCLAAAKTIVHEVKDQHANEGPIIWTMQAFGVAAAIILSLDNFNRHQSAREYAENRQAVTQIVEILSGYVAISSIAARGTRLLTELLAEEHKMQAQAVDAIIPSQMGNEWSADINSTKKSYEKGLNVAAFVKKFCESDQPRIGASSIGATNVPLWLQDNVAQSQFGSQRVSDNLHDSAQQNGHFLRHQHIPQPSYQPSEADPQIHSTARRPFDTFADTFGQTTGESFDIKSVNWFDDLLGLAPSHSI